MMEVASKIIHWEYNSEIFPFSKPLDPVMKAGFKYRPPNDEKVGVFFRWTYLSQFESQVGLHCVCEGGYTTINIPSFSLTKLNLLRALSFKEFNLLLVERLNLIGISIPYFQFQGKEEELIEIYNQLKH